MAIPSAHARIDDIEKYRERVIAHPWAQDLTRDSARSYLGDLPRRRFPAVAYAEKGDAPLIQPRGGVPTFADQQALTRQLDEAGADFIPLTIDSNTRHNRYDVAAELLARSEEEEKNYLNGYPLIAHGFRLTRDLYRDLDKPVSLRHGTPDARLLAEVALASGIVEIEGGGICYCLPYSEGFPLDRCLLYWQYVDRICALHSTDAAPVHRESFGPLTATMVPPSLVVVVQILEALLAAEQGVTSFAVSFAQTGSPSQDVATAQVLRKLVRHYLDSFGFEAVNAFLVFHQWMGQFPTDRTCAAALITASAQIGGMIGADKIVVKTTDEALGVPTAAINAEAVRNVRYVFDRFRWADQVGSSHVEVEAELIESEARSVIEAIFDLPGELLWESVFRAFQQGIIDIPFSPHIDNANQMITMRDANGSIRIKESGNVPIQQADRKRERELLASREKASGKTFRSLLIDINMMS